MSAWEYEALDDRGRPRNGTLAAASEREAREHLVRRRLWPLRLSPTTTPAAGLRGRFGARELALATRQLATLAAVAPMEEALRTIGTQSERPGTRRVLLSTQAAVVVAIPTCCSVAAVKMTTPRVSPGSHGDADGRGGGWGISPAGGSG